MSWCLSGMWCVGPCCVMNNSWIALSAFCKQWAPELHCHTTHVDLCFFLFHQEVLSVAHKACWDKHKVFPACRIFCARISLAIRCIHVVLFDHKTWTCFGAQNSVEWLVSFTQHFQSYCLLTPLVSLTDTKCNLIDRLIEILTKHDTMSSSLIFHQIPFSIFIFSLHPNILKIDTYGNLLSISIL